MYRTCIAVVDASRARLFTYERSSDPGGVHANLVEARDLVNPSRRLRPAQLFSDSRPGSSRTGGLQYGFDDHRDAHVEQLDAAFSRFVVEQVTDLTHEAHAHQMILCASPHMLGQLRAAGVESIPDVEITELARDLVKLTSSQLREHLEAQGLLPGAQPAH